MNGNEVVKITYDDTTLPGISETVTLFDSTVAHPGAQMHQGSAVYRFFVEIFHDRTGNIDIEFSNDRGATWLTSISDNLVATGTRTRDTATFFVGFYRDFRILWVNSTTAQTDWNINMYTATPA